MSTTTALLKKQLSEIEELKNLPSAESPKFKKWNQVSKTIIKHRFGENKADEFPGLYNFWPNRIGPHEEEELKMALITGLDTAHAFLEGLVEEIELLGEESQNTFRKNVRSKNQNLRDINVSNGNLIWGDDVKISQITVGDVAYALIREIEKKVPESEEKRNVIDSLKKITANETFASLAGVFVGELMKRVGTV